MGNKSGRSETVIITTDIAAQPAVCAWRALERGGAAPERVELLRRRGKSVVYRLPGVGVGGGDVIAKHCFRDSAHAEREVYVVLRELPVSSPGYYGYVEGDLEGFGWLFLEDVGGVLLDLEDPAHRELATRWLATLHTTSSRSPLAARLPDRGCEHYLDHLKVGHAEIGRIMAEREISTVERDVFDDLRFWLDRIEHRWSVIESICAEVPRALVHGDIAPRNARVRHDASHGAALLAFDWEVAGWGLPGVDLAGMDHDLYFALVRSAWPSLDRDTLLRAASVGRLLRGGVAAIRWDTVKYLGNRYHTLADMLIFRQRLIDEMTWLGWENGGELRSFPQAPPRLLPGAAPREGLGATLPEAPQA